MALVYVARSAALTKWASDVGQGKHIYKLGVAEDEAAAKAAITTGGGGEADWKLVQSKPVEELDEETALTRLSRPACGRRCGSSTGTAGRGRWPRRSPSAPRSS